MFCMAANTGMQPICSAGAPQTADADREANMNAMTVLWVAGLLLPYLLFAGGNPFRSFFVSARRALVAVLAGLAYFVAYADAGNAFTIAAARTCEEFIKLQESNPNRALSDAAAVSGCLIAALVVIVAWVMYDWRFSRRSV